MEPSILAALISSVALVVIGVSSILINLITVKKQINSSVLSGNRQPWINEFRDVGKDPIASG